MTKKESDEFLTGVTGGSDDGNADRRIAAIHYFKGREEVYWRD
jgi:hypothetical protein